MRLVPWQPDDMLRRLDDVVSVYGEAKGYRAELLQTRRGYIGAHVRRAGFRAVATLTTDGHLAGFGYGYASGPGADLLAVGATGCGSWLRRPGCWRGSGSARRRSAGRARSLSGAARRT